MAFDLKKKFNHSDINNFLFDSQTVGTFDFYKNKFQNKFPDHYYELFEVLSRSEYNDEKCNELIERVREEDRRINKQIIDEYRQRCAMPVGQAYNERFDEAIDEAAIEAKSIIAINELNKKED